MELRAPYGLSITTFEGLDPSRVVLTHIFWGQTEEEAISYARSHLISDGFFSSSFVGQMSWGDSVLLLRNSGEMIQRGYSNPDRGADILHQLAQEAAKVNYEQRRAGILMQITRLSREL